MVLLDVYARCTGQTCSLGQEGQGRDGTRIRDHEEQDERERRSSLRCTCHCDSARANHSEWCVWKTNCKFYPEPEDLEAESWFRVSEATTH